MKIKKLILSVILFIAIAISAIFAMRTFAKTTLLTGVKVADIAIGGMNYDDGLVTLEKEITPFLKQSLIIKYNQKELPTDLRALGITFNGLKTIENAYEISFGDDYLDHIGTRINGIIGSIAIDPIFEIDRNQLQIEIKRLIPDIQNAQPASLVIDEKSNIEVVTQQNGMSVDFDLLASSIERSLLRLELPNINIKTSALHSAYTEEIASKDAELMTPLINQEVRFTYYQDGELFYEHKLLIPPNWMDVKNEVIKYNKNTIQDYLEKNIAMNINRPKGDAIIESVTSELGGYATVIGLAKDGLSLNIEKTTDNLIENIVNRKYEVNLVVDTLTGQIVNQTSVDLGDMSLLGYGRSNFKGSPEGRDFNVRKGFNEKVNNILLAPGELYSFNSKLGPVTHSAGWKDSLAIFGGKDLIPVPGGGLCQTSTTVYRAIVSSGLKLVEKSNHSLYVSYYKEYGDGLDAAIYPGSKDLRFLNDTDNYVLIQAYDDGFDGYVKIYGTSDGRSVDLFGPFYNGKVPPEYQDTVKPRWNQIIWIQKLTRPNGEVEEEQLVSTYRTAPR